MKKLLYLFFALSVTVGLNACSSDDGPANESPAQTPENPDTPGQPDNPNPGTTGSLPQHRLPSMNTPPRPRARSSMIARNVPARYPDIRFVVPHCGSFLSLAIPRMKAILPAMQAKGYMKSVDWEANLANLYYDLAGGATPEVVKSLLTITTPDHLLYGSDYPYQLAEVLTENLKRMRLWIAEDEALVPYSEDILAGNALALFGGKTDRLDNRKMNSGSRTGMCAKLPMQPDGIVRLSKIEVHPEHLEEYMKYAAEVGEISLRTEPGVLTMYAVQEQDNPCHITILETYASRKAYEKHIASEHFQKYKQGTLHMVKSLVLSDQTPLNPANRINNYIQ